MNKFIQSQIITGIVTLKRLASSSNSIKHLVDIFTPSLIPDIPSIYAQLDHLETYRAIF